MKRSRLFLGVCLGLAALSGNLAAAQAQTAQIESAAAPASVYVYTFHDQAVAAGAAIEVDGEPRGTTDAKGVLATTLPPGAHEIVVKHADDEPIVIPVELVAGEQLQISASSYSTRPALYQLKSSVNGDKTVDLAAVAPASAPESATADVAADVTTSVDAPTDAAVAPSEDGGDASATLQGIEVRGQYTQGARSLYVDERRASAQVTEALGAEEIARTADSDVAQSLKRVTGLTLVENRFVYVRGLGERYSSVLLNGAQIPSPDPTRRVVPLDLFPNDILDGIIISKSFSPNVPAEFGGGTVMLRTRGNPGRFYMKVGAGLGYADGTTGEDGLRYAGGDQDWTGYDDERELPDSLADAIADGRVLSPQTPFNPDGLAPQQFEQVGEDLAGGYDLYQDSLDPNAVASATIGNDFQFEGWTLGVLGAVRHSQSWDTVEEERRVFGVAGESTLVPAADLARDKTERAIDSSSFLNVDARLGESHLLKSTTMLLRQTTDDAQIDEGFADGDPEEQSRYYELEWEENELFAQQIGGEHDFPDLNYLGFNWLYTFAKASREAPNTRRYRYDRVGDEWRFSTRSNSNQTTFAELDDDSRQFQADFEMPWQVNDETSIVFTGGVDTLKRERDSSIRRFQFIPVGPLANDPDVRGGSLEDILNPNYIGPNGFQLSEVTRGTDNYTAEQDLDAAFLNADATISTAWRANLGFRYEKNEQSVETVEVGSPSATPVVSTLDDKDLLPSFSLTYFQGDNTQYRLAYGETVSRPDFRELSPAPFTDPLLDIETIGNPDLEKTDIKNLDLRYEYYFTPEESFSAALFYKDFTLPIEKVFVAGTGNVLSFLNAESAEVYGVELDVFKRLSFLEERIGGAMPWQNLFVSANLALVESKVSLGDRETIQTTDNRELQGTSPYVVNVQFGYQSQDGQREATLAYNRFGERISQVGTSGAPDIYEQPFDQLDLIFSQEFAKDWRVRVRLGNLLDPEVQYEQGDELTREYRKGRDLSVLLEWRPQ